MRQYIEVNRLHKDKLHGKISGVCAGLAKYWNQPRWLIRVGAIVALFCLPMVTSVAYVTAVLLLPSR
ncbi:MAG: PspC domain-containing protein [Paraglaciecola sp.]|uniref:PspC domain-containing protein n=1 Tax=Paraglaciecola sp. TaxID=1920173 RepID=UPI00273DB3FE|nr:PspC domain-containing protein [Paraglaciecola sp.]MDP5030201.1 PspC domain-containing protein [Paraglaciecola sp.]MDP5131250.1 PspC domain-containing protein [Paraglaciecola sp.]